MVKKPVSYTKKKRSPSEISEDNYDATDPYEVSIILNRRYNLRPGVGRYIVTSIDPNGISYYGIYDAKYKAEKDIRKLDLNITPIKEEKDNTYRAIQYCYDTIMRHNANNPDQAIEISPIEFGNCLVRARPAQSRLFTVV